MPRSASSDRFFSQSPASFQCSAAFWKRHLAWLIPGGLLLFVLQITGLDHRLAQLFYHWQGNSWQWQDQWLLEMVIHRWAKYLLLLAYLGVVILAVLSGKVAAWRPYRRGLWYLVAALALGTLTVSALKAVTHMDCPWDLLEFGGNKPFVSLFQRHPGTFAYGHCFPAAHASAAYTWFALYFFVLVYFPAWRWRVLAAVIATGLLFGFAQQLRGAHFLSHDLASAMVTWLVSQVLFALFFCRKGG